MKGEIDNDFYCSTAGAADCPENGGCGGYPDRHRKFLTPEQFKQEYGEEWKGATYILVDIGGDGDRREEIFWEAYPRVINDYPCVCASTPWGCPPADWRPE